MCTTIMIVELAVTSGMRSSFDYMVGWEQDGVWLCLCGMFVITLCPFVPL
jgi:hypothetical protein